MPSVPGVRRSRGQGRGNPLQCSCLQSAMDRNSWQAAVHWVAKSLTQLSTQTHTHPIWSTAYTSQKIDILLHNYVFFPEKFRRQKSLAGYSPWGHKRVRHDLVTKQQYPYTGETISKIFLLKVFFSTITDHKEEKTPPIYDRLLSSINQF